MAKPKIRKNNVRAAIPIQIRESEQACERKNDTTINKGKDEYYLASMFPNNDVMHRIYSIIKSLEES